MTDLEMLELAAKAAGIKVLRSRLEDKACRDMLVSDSVRNPDQDAGPWNPRDDSGDALRLAVRLRLHIAFEETDVEVYSAGVRQWVVEPYGTDPDAATRIAILRCAAEVGRWIG